MTRFKMMVSAALLCLSATAFADPGGRRGDQDRDYSPRPGTVVVRPNPVVVRPTPRPVVIQQPAPRRGYVWAPAHFEQRGHRQVWVAGEWVRARRNRVFVAAHWEMQHGRYVFVAAKYVKQGRRA